jgi:hypothetical protein
MAPNSARSKLGGGPGGNFSAPRRVVTTEELMQKC